MKLVNNSITKAELVDMSAKMFSGLVKAVVDLEKKIMMVDAAMHVDLEAELLKSGSKQENLWGINFYPEVEGEDFIEFDSMINIRPSQGNLSRNIESESVKKEIRLLVNTLVI